MTNGNSNSLFVFSYDQDDAFDVNFNRAKIFLHGGAGDDRFVRKTFLVLKENTEDAEEVTNLTNAFGSADQSVRLLDKGPAFINRDGIDTLVVIGTASDTVVPSYLLGQGRSWKFC